LTFLKLIVTNFAEH